MSNNEPVVSSTVITASSTEPMAYSYWACCIEYLACSIEYLDYVSNAEPVVLSKGSFVSSTGPAVQGLLYRVLGL